MTEKSEFCQKIDFYDTNYDSVLLKKWGAARSI